MNTSKQTRQEHLISLLRHHSKHSHYQELHPLLSNLLIENYTPSGKSEYLRQLHIDKKTSFLDKNVLDIGANTGYFTFSAIEKGARKVDIYEGNTEHANFILSASQCLGDEFIEKITINNSYFLFDDSDYKKYDIGLCLNVLHHLGDDFGDSSLSKEKAKGYIANALNSLASCCGDLWLQIGYNWKGDREKPLFKTGTKEEIIDFIISTTKDHWLVVDTSIYDPTIESYTDINEHNLQRFDELGEFLNRPLFLLKSKKILHQETY